MNDRTVITAPFRLSFPNLPPSDPRVDPLNGRKTFSINALLPPDTDLAPYKAAMRAAMVDKFGDNQKNWPKIKRKPEDVLADFAAYNDAQKKPLAGDWSGWHRVPASMTVKETTEPPKVVHNFRGEDGKLKVVVDPREIYSGRWARAEIEAYYYSIQGGGVTFGLRSVQLLKKDDVRFGGGPRAAEDAFSDPVAKEYEDAAAGVSESDADGWN